MSKDAEKRFDKMLEDMAFALDCPVIEYYKADDRGMTKPVRGENPSLMGIFDGEFEALKPFAHHELRQIEELLAEHGYLLSSVTFRPIDIKRMFA